MDNKLNASVAAYKIREIGVPYNITPPVGNTDPYCCNADGAEESKGIDAEIKGEILPGWQFSAGYTFNENYYTASLDPSRPPLVTKEPKHLLKLWTMAQLPGSLSRFRVGGGVDAQTVTYRAGSIYISNAAGQITQEVDNVHLSQGGYAILSLAGDYKLNDHWAVQLNINNVTDRKYLSTLGYVNGIYYGTPLDFTLNVRAKF
jgi:outer membrane receptor for ferric coprogen and ferric-rhodotorulic acid